MHASRPFLVSNSWGLFALSVADEAGSKGICFMTEPCAAVYVRWVHDYRVSVIYIRAHVGHVRRYQRTPLSCFLSFGDRVSR